MAAESLSWPDRPLVSLLMPVYNSQPDWLRDAVASVRSQSYDRWQLCVVDDASTAAHVQPLLAELAAGEARIEVLHRAANGGIAAASQSALEMARGEFVGFLDHDDVLQPHALHSMVARLRSEPGLDMVYSDEDKLLLDGRRGEVFFKPDWSPDLLLAVNYIAHFTVIRRSVLIEAGGFRPGYDGAQDYDLFLRVVELARGVGHVADVLYSWRQVPGSAALAGDEKPYAHDAGRRAIADALNRRGRTARVDLPGPSLYEVHYQTRGRPTVAVIPWGGGAGAWDGGAGYGRLEIRPAGEGGWKALNEAARPARSQFLLFVNAGLAPRHPDWIGALLEHGLHPEVGAVGGRLYGADGASWQEGLGLGLGPAVQRLVYGEYFAMGRRIRDVSAVSASCLITRRSLFEELGGFDQDYERDHADADYCLRLRERGLLVVYSPMAELSWTEPPTGRTEHRADADRLRSRWGSRGVLCDPYVGPHIIPEGRVRIRLGAGQGGGGPL